MHYNFYIILIFFYQSVFCYGVLQSNRPWIFNLPSFSNFFLINKETNLRYWIKMLQCMGLFALTCINTAHPFITYIDVLPLLPVCFGYTDYKLLSKNKSNTLSWKIHQRKTFNRRFIRPYFVMLGYWVLIKNLRRLFLRQTTGSDPGSGQESKWLISHA